MIRIIIPKYSDSKALLPKYKVPTNKYALKKASFSKGMYYVSNLGHFYFVDIECIKPKSKYPKLEFDWNKLGYCSAICNNNKSDKYDESTPYINP